METKKFLLSVICVFACVFSVQAQTLYGLAPAGGDDGGGALIKFMPATNNLTVPKSFESAAGWPTYTHLVQTSDGKLYGMADGGGKFGHGVIFSFDPSSSIYAKLKDFDGINGDHPYGSLMQANDGKLYGMTHQGGSSNRGVIFSFDPLSSTYTKLKDFDYADGANPYGSLIQASDGKLYGMTGEGGSSNAGVIFSFDPLSFTYTKLKNFDFTNGGTPYGSLVQASDGKLYGMAGVIFSFDPSTSTYTKLKDIDGTNGGYHYGSLVQASDGKLYGMGNNIFSFDPSSSNYTKLKDFDMINGADGYNPHGSLVQASNGMLYGVTSEGGNGTGAGVIFSFDPSSSTYTKLKDFEKINGDNPYGSLMQASDGKLYGMTLYGGSNSWGWHAGTGSGVIFSFDPSSSTYISLKDFCNTAGSQPMGSLMQANDGKLYGMTTYGGNAGSGVIFSFDPFSSTYTRLKDFDGINGADPYGSLMQANDGKLYGMTRFGGGGSAIFSFDPSSSTYLKLKDIGVTGGYDALGSLIQASDGKLYGMTFNSANGEGVIFSFDPVLSICTTLFYFERYSENGYNPVGSLMQASDGKLYGMTYSGGSYGGGVIFSFDLSSSTYVKLKDFDGTNGGNPNGSLIQARDGKLYGMASNIFSFDPSTSTYTKLQDFDGTNFGYPWGSLMQASDGKLYGRTGTGGSSNAGVIFSFDPTTSTYTKLGDLDWNKGSSRSDIGILDGAFIEVSNSGGNGIIPAVSIALSSGTNPACAGQSVTFSATPTNGGTSPIYQWKVNGTNVGTNSPTYTTNTLTNGQVVSIVMTSNAPNASPTTATSNSITLTVNSAVTPIVTIAINAGANPTCTGQSVTFTATPTNGGTSPIYQWKVNGTNVGTNSPTYTTTTLTNGQVVSCVVTSNLSCVNQTIASSNNITMAVNPAVAPVITITQTSCTATTVGFTANINNGGASPSYLWSFTGTGTATNFTGPDFTLSNVAIGAQVQCLLTSNADCVNPIQVSSSPLIINCINNCAGGVSPVNLNFQVYPNPARQDAVISFSLCQSVRISIDVFNIVGQQIAILEDRVLNTGNQTIPWNTDKLAAGVYFVRLQTVNYSTAKQVVVIH